MSKPFSVCKGTEQGHPMSPDLFKLFILDLSRQFSLQGSYPELQNSIVNHLFWADDLVLFGLDQASLQKNLDILQNFCETWGLEINLKKTKVVCFGRKLSCKFELNGKPVDFKDKYTYLGVTITKNGHVNIARADLRNRALRALFALNRHANREYITPRSLLILFDSLIKPILLYSCQVLLPYTPLFAKVIDANREPVQYFQNISRDIHELFHLRYLKWVLGVHKKASNVGTYGETGRLPLLFDSVKLSCDYFERCEALPENSLVKKAFLEQKRLDLNWYHNIQEILSCFSKGTSRSTSINVFQSQRKIFKKNYLLS